MRRCFCWTLASTLLLVGCQQQSALAPLPVTAPARIVPELATPELATNASTFVGPPPPVYARVVLVPPRPAAPLAASRFAEIREAQDEQYKFTIGSLEVCGLVPVKRFTETIARGKLVRRGYLPTDEKTPFDKALVIRFLVKPAKNERTDYYHPGKDEVGLSDEHGNVLRVMYKTETGLEAVGEVGTGHSDGADSNLAAEGSGLRDLFLFEPTNLGKGETLVLTIRGNQFVLDQNQVSK
jgi:hypothetical protein